jgi:hypothetical protein
VQCCRRINRVLGGCLLISISQNDTGLKFIRIHIQKYLTDVKCRHYYYYYGRGVNHTPPSDAEVKEKVELHCSFFCAFLASYRLNFYLLLLLLILLQSINQSIMNLGLFCYFSLIVSNLWLWPPLSNVYCLRVFFRIKLPQILRWHWYNQNSVHAKKEYLGDVSLGLRSTRFVGNRDVCAIKMEAGSIPCWRRSLISVGE